MMIEFFSKAHVAGIVLSLSLIVIIIELVRRKQLREEYSLLWLLTGGVLLVLALWRSSIDFIAGLVGIYYPPSALFLLGLIFLVILMLNITTVISRQTEQNKQLTQEVALLKEKLEELTEDKEPRQEKE